jgi:hypothetical protein
LSSPEISRLAIVSSERHQHPTDLFPREWLAADDDQRQPAVRFGVQFDAADKALVAVICQPCSVRST